MLTSALLMFQFRNGKFRIRFADTVEPDLLLLAEQLINCFAAAAERRCSRDELLSELSLTRSLYAPKVADGLIKLLCDRTEFSIPQELDLVSVRKRVFSAVPELLKSCDGDFSVYRSKVRELAGGQEDLYGDLPGFEKIVKFSPLKPAELLDRYNLALAQGMLFFAEKMTVELSDPEPAELRRVLKYLKFFRLLAEVKKVSASAMTLEISGPYSLLGHTRKYALNLAVFFPAVVRLKHWSVAADLDVNGRKGTFKLDESSKLVSHYRSFSAYVPEEVRLFHRLFAQKVSRWKIIGETPVLDAGKQEFVIPDISFSNEESKVIHLELFHRWHRTRLRQRLETLANSNLPLIAGIDRSIMGNDEFDELIEQFPNLAAKLFRFSDFPGVDTVLRILNKQ